MLFDKAENVSIICQHARCYTTFKTRAKNPVLTVHHDCNFLSLQITGLYTKTKKELNVKNNNQVLNAFTFETVTFVKIAKLASEHSKAKLVWDYCATTPVQRLQAQLSGRKYLTPKGSIPPYLLKTVITVMSRYNAIGWFIIGAEMNA